MRFVRFGAGAVSLSVLLLTLSLVGCGGGSKDGSATTDGSTPSKDGTPTPSGKKKAVAAGNATIKGKVTLEGEKPDIQALNNNILESMKKVAADFPTCHGDSTPEEDKGQQTWTIGEDGGVADVFVFLVPAPGTFFAVEESHPGVEAVKDKEVFIDQPYCAFHPHSLILFPQFRDANEKVDKTGQKLIVKNSAKVAHNTKLQGGSKNPLQNETVKPGGTFNPRDLQPDTNPVNVQCSIHPWMNANIWVLEHPYFAITKKDGTFEIKNAPTGKVHITAWHEGDPKKFLVAEGYRGKAIDVKDGDNTVDFKIKAR